MVLMMIVLLITIENIYDIYNIHNSNGNYDAYRIANDNEDGWMNEDIKANKKKEVSKHHLQGHDTHPQLENTTREATPK